MTKTYTGKTFTLADGRVTPALAWGNCALTGKTPDEVALEVAPIAFDAGFEHLDTAQIYQNQESTAEFLAKYDPDQKLFLTTKLSSKRDGPKTLEEARETILETIKILGRQPDAFLVHNPFVCKEGLTALWGLLDELKDSGAITGSLGISNFHPKHIEEVVKVAKHKPQVHQLEVHPYVLSHIQPILDLGEKYSILTTSYGPLTPFSKHPTGGPAKPIFEKIGARLSKEHGVDADGSSALVLYLRSKKVGPVLGTHNPERIKRYLETSKFADLSAEEIAEIDEVSKKVYFRNFDEHIASTDVFPRPSLPEDI